MKTVRRVVLWYSLIVLAIFVYGYFVSNVREMALYLFIVGLNIPASLVIEPLASSAALSADVALGTSLHVIATQIACLVANCFLILGITYLASRLRRRKPAA